MTLLPIPLSLAACASAPAIAPNPYTADQIVRLLRGAVSHERILHDARRECIAFEITPAIEQELASAGATPEFVTALADVCRTAPSRSAAAVSPSLRH